MKKITQLTITSALLLNSGALLANELAYTSAADDIHISSILTEPAPAETAWVFDLGWDSKYMSQGRDLIGEGGITWATAVYEYENLAVFASLGRGDSTAYIEWDLGIEYGLDLTDNLEATLGLMHIHCFGDDDFRDNELSASLRYTQYEWFTPSVTYIYSTEAAGYRVNASIHSSWDLTETLSVTPYVTQGFDFQYSSEEHNGPNHFQFGVEAEYQLQENLSLSAQISHSIAQEDIKQQYGHQEDLDQTFGGVHITWIF
ncbi:hypothetical protein LZP69_14650 [Shewanella sp. AS1]|uniref:hypothetical protein n=1 Tax=Shewanella sp. AS1 TaxID=2907626 RepID=UPI001F3A2DF9|nr:hypothetical protein [Shewanella sp. AS1]MCE9680395.1 hypothetical protein [Shewanella sp. AS1]